MAETREEWKRRMGVGERQSAFHLHQGTTKTEWVKREDNGQIGGRLDHRMDGSNDCTVFPALVQKQGTLNEQTALRKALGSTL